MTVDLPQPFLVGEAADLGFAQRQRNVVKRSAAAERLRDVAQFQQRIAAGGRGSALVVCLAAPSLMLLASGFQVLRFSNFLIDFIWGWFLLAVIALNVLRARRT